MSITDIQKLLSKQNLQALLITRNKSYFVGEDILPQENKILDLTGFSGSAGNLLISQNHAWLFVDGRYSIQARNETDSNIITVVDYSGSFAEILEICTQNNIKQLAYNPECLSVATVKFLKKHAPDITFSENTDLDTLDNEPASSTVKVFQHDIKFCGKSSKEKCAEVIADFPPFVDAMLICASDLVSWLSNLRSYDLPDTPIVRAWGLLERSGKLTLIADNLEKYGFKPFAELSKLLSQYMGKTIFIDEKQTPQIVLSLLPEGVKIETKINNPIVEHKLTKNPVELEGYKNSHLRDGVAVSKFLCWLDDNYQNISELDVVAKLRSLRQEQELFFSDSFATIAATASNAAIVHYQPNENSNKKLENNSVLLLDSGAQYYDGTTDVTRTIALGNPSDEIKESFTQVLKAHIALASAIFPQNTPANVLDAVCRQPLWQQGKDYKHGTGHSVGHFSDVHEAPFGLSLRSHMPVKANYITSIEPGYYKENAYGIRIENLVYTTNSEYDGFLKFQYLTLIPIDKHLINKYLLNDSEVSWLNNYHSSVYNALAPYMNKAELKWLKKACAPL